LTGTVVLVKHIQIKHTHALVCMSQR